MAIIVKGRQFTGPRARFEYQGIIIGWAASISFGHMHSREEMAVVGDLEKVEDVPLAYRPSFGAAQFSLVDQSPITLGMTPDCGQNSEQHLLNLLEIGDASVVLTDRVSGNIVGLIEGVQMVSANQNIGTNSMVMTDQAFTCKRVHYFGSQAAA